MSANPNFHLSEDSRILILSKRNLHDHASRCGGYEFEDIILKSDRVDLYSPSNSYSSAQEVYKRLKRVIRFSKLADILKPDPNPLVLERQYDLFFFVCTSPWDLLTIRSIKNWRRNCRQAICYIEELWMKDLKGWKPLLELLRDFDHVFLAYSGSLEGVEEIVGCPCTYLPPAVDTLEFNSYPSLPYRGIDVLNMGRRSDTTHEALLSLSRQGKIFYQFDTLKNFNVRDAKEHRHLLSSSVKRSRYFFTYRARVDQPEQTLNQQEIGYRYFEGAAAGAVLLGEHLTTPVFKDNFDWQDAVIPVPFDCPNIADIITELENQPERQIQISRENMVQSLLRHDWVHRWAEVLKVAGLRPALGMVQRQHQLQQIADSLTLELVESLWVQKPRNHRQLWQINTAVLAEDRDTRSNQATLSAAKYQPVMKS